MHTQANLKPFIYKTILHFFYKQEKNEGSSILVYLHCHANNCASRTKTYFQRRQPSVYIRNKRRQNSSSAQKYQRKNFIRSFLLIYILLQIRNYAFRPGDPFITARWVRSVPARLLNIVHLYRACCFRRSSRIAIVRTFYRNVTNIFFFASMKSGYSGMTKFF